MVCAHIFYLGWYGLIVIIGNDEREVRVQYLYGSDPSRHLF
jgi:hypothetical protein